jgi:hypothetical protein
MTSSLPLHRALALLTLGTALAACGGGGGSSFSSGVDGSKPIASLSPDENTKLCKAAADYAKEHLSKGDAKEVGCRLIGIVGGIAGSLGGGGDAAIRSACKQTYDECMKSEGTVMQDSTCSAPTGTCTATVADYEACVREAPESLDDVRAKLPTCAEVTQASLASFQKDVADARGPACKALAAKCPGGSQPFRTPGTTGP